MSTRGPRLGSGSGSGFGEDPIDERLHDLITVEVTRCICDATPMIFGTIKEVIM